MESILMWLIYPDLRTLLNPLLLLLDPVVIQHNFSRLSTYSTGHLVHPFLQHLRILTFVSFLFSIYQLRNFYNFCKVCKKKFQRSFKNIRLIKFVCGALPTLQSTQLLMLKKQKKMGAQYKFSILIVQIYGDGINFLFMKP